ncbi:MAG: inositol monophosphatase family protein [Phycisphaerales bacterium JB059]
MPRPLRMNRQDLLHLALDVARAGGKAAMTRFRSDSLAVESKADGSAVTVADRQAESAMRLLLDAHVPGDAVLGEEFSGEHQEAIDSEAPRQWILDPIDGTASFICGVPLFGTLVGVVEHGRPVIGVIHLPALDETVYAATGLGAWSRKGTRPPTRAHVSAITRPDRATLCTTSDDYFRMTRTRWVWEALRDRVASTRGWSDCYALALLATGRIDAVVEPPVLHPWDVAGCIPVVLEAGGLWTDWHGETGVHGRSALVANRALHPRLLDLIRSAEPSPRSAPPQTDPPA